MVDRRHRLAPGSQAEIFDGFLAAGLTGVEAPGADSFTPIWAHWDALSPAEQVTSSVRANEDFVSRVEGLPPAKAAGFSVSVFGMDLDLAGLAAVRLGEHVLHTWDVTVALDLTSVLPRRRGRGARPRPGPAARSRDEAGAGRRHRAGPHDGAETSYVVDLATGTPSEGPATSTVSMPAEAWVRLVYGRLDAEHAPTGSTTPTACSTCCGRRSPASEGRLLSAGSGGDAAQHQDHEGEHQEHRRGRSALVSLTRRCAPSARAK